MPGPSLNQLISTLSDRVGQPFNVPLQEELKVILNYKRENYLQQFLERHPEQRAFFQQKVEVPLIPVPQPECDTPKHCVALRSKCEVPPPVRVSQITFDFVGTADFRDGYGQLAPEFLQFHLNARFTYSRPKWFYQDDHIWIYNNRVLDRIGLRGVFRNPEDVNQCLCDAALETCYDDDQPWPVAGDLINAIMRDVLNVELRNMFPEPGVVKVDEREDLQAASEE
jgi:hypothetical protein